MTRLKQRVTITVDPELIAAGHDAVDSGRAESLSAWVSDAIEAKLANERRLNLLASAVADYEREFGEITTAEIAAQQRADRATAIVVRGRRSRPARPTTSA